MSADSRQSVALAINSGEKASSSIMTWLGLRWLDGAVHGLQLAILRGEL